MCERRSVSERESVCVCICVYMSVSECCERERIGILERERERVCVRACVRACVLCVYMDMYVYVCVLTENHLVLCLPSTVCALRVYLSSHLCVLCALFLSQYPAKCASMNPPVQWYNSSSGNWKVLCKHDMLRRWLQNSNLRWIVFKHKLLWYVCVVEYVHVRVHM
jgi:hypothetical protein